MLIDINNIAKACWQNKYQDEEYPKFEEQDIRTEENIDELIHYVGNMEVAESRNELETNLVAALKTILTISHIKQFDLNKFFRCSVNLID